MDANGDEVVPNNGVGNEADVKGLGEEEEVKAEELNAGDEVG